MENKRLKEASGGGGGRRRHEQGDNLGLAAAAETRELEGEGQQEMVQTMLDDLREREKSLELENRY